MKNIKYIILIIVLQSCSAKFTLDDMAYDYSKHIHSSPNINYESYVDNFYKEYFQNSSEVKYEVKLQKVIIELQNLLSNEVNHPVNIIKKLKNTEDKEKFVYDFAYTRDVYKDMKKCDFIKKNYRNIIYLKYLYQTKIVYRDSTCIVKKENIFHTGTNILPETEKYIIELIKSDSIGYIYKMSTFLKKHSSDIPIVRGVYTDNKSKLDTLSFLNISKKTENLKKQYDDMYEEWK